MTENNTTPSSGKKQRATRPGGNRSGKHRSSAAKQTGENPNRGAVNNGINFKAEAGEDNPIWQAVNYAYNRLCGSRSNQTSPFSAIELLAYTREKFGPKTMTVGQQAA
jgi:hypothetical protein